MDRSTLPGVLVGFAAMLIAFLMEGGSPMALLNPSAAIIVLGGTLGAALISFPLASVLSSPKSFVRACLEKPLDPSKLVDTFVRLADRARREGLLSLEQEAESLEPFTRKGLLLVVDGSDSELVREVLESEISAMQRRHKTAYGLFEAMGGFAPTMGIIGTVMGLVNVLSKLEDPTELGHSIAVAFIATLYGVATANLLWLPIGSKLKLKSETEAWTRELIIEGILTVQAGDNPRLVREKLESQLPPSLRSAAKSKAGADQAVGEPVVAPAQ